jgi:C-terminal processing protease CtpA/Prc
VIVVTVIPDSPAAKAKFRPGDVIVEIAGTRAERFESIRSIRELFEAKEGTKYRIVISRGGRRETLSLTLETYI